MPSIGTSVLAARLKDESIRKIKTVAEEYNTTVPKILDALAGTTPDYSGALSAFFDATETKGIEFVRFLREKGFSDDAIEQCFENLKGQL